MFFVYLFYAELIILPLLLISVFVHQRIKMQSLALQLADVSAKLDTVERAQTRAPRRQMKTCDNSCLSLPRWEPVPSGLFSSAGQRSMEKDCSAERPMVK